MVLSEVAEYKTYRARVLESKSISKTHPEIVKLWHPSKNGAWKPENFTSGSFSIAWWLCKKGPDHEWQASITQTTKSTTCPFCLNRKVSKTNSLKKLNPKLAKEWHPSKNGKLKPEDVTCRTSQKIWWQCKKKMSHVWFAPIRSRTLLGSGCPFCSGRIADEDTNLEVMHPELAREWYQRMNGELKPQNCTIRCSLPVYWQCSNDKTHT